jgi:hypothetical protein
VATARVREFDHDDKVNGYDGPGLAVAVVPVGAVVLVVEVESHGEYGGDGGPRERA